MKSVRSLIASFVVLLPAASCPADDIADWKTYPLASHGKLTVNLRVRPEATLADEQWIAIEFLNLSESPIGVKEARYTVDSSYVDFLRGQAKGRECLCGGNSQSQ